MKTFKRKKKDTSTLWRQCRAREYVVSWWLFKQWWVVCIWTWFSSWWHLMHVFAGRLWCCSSFLNCSRFHTWKYCGLFFYKVASTACPCFLAYDLFKNNIENLLSLAYALWWVLRAIRWNFVPLGKKYLEHTPFGECSGQSDGSFCLHGKLMQEVSRAYAFWRVFWAPEHIIALWAFVLGNRISKG